MHKIKKIKVGLQRAFVLEFSAEAVRRGLTVRREAYHNLMSAEYQMETALGTVRLAAGGSKILLHVYRRFEDVDRARPAMKWRTDFNPHSGKWNTWQARVEDGEQVTALVARAFDELDRLEKEIKE